MSQQFHVGSGTIYVVFIRGVAQGLIESEWRDEPVRRRAYQLTTLGHAWLALTVRRPPFDADWQRLEALFPRDVRP